MAYLNDIKLVSYLANNPEMAMTHDGRPYSNIKVRLVQKTKTGEERSDYLTVTCFDYDAEIVVRDAKQGDLIMVVGHVAQHRWEKDGNRKSKVIVVADHVSILAKGNGTVPPPSLEDVRNSDLCINEDGIVSWVTGIIYTGDKQNANGFRYGSRYPQPKGDGTWSVPAVKGDPGVQKWAQERGMAAKKGMYVEKNPSINGNLIYIENERVKNLAQGIYPDNLKPYRGYVRMPDGKRVKVENYLNIIASQDRTLMALPETERQAVIALAGKVKGIHLQYERYFPEYRQRMQDMEQQRQQQQAQAVAQDKATQGTDGNHDSGDRTDVSDPIGSSKGKGELNEPAPIAGANPDEWYQDEDGKWLRRKSQ